MLHRISMSCLFPNLRGRWETCSERNTLGRWEKSAQADSNSSWLISRALWQAQRAKWSPAGLTGIPFGLLCFSISFTQAPLSLVLQLKCVFPASFRRHKIMVLSLCMPNFDFFKKCLSMSYWIHSCHKIEAKIMSRSQWGPTLFDLGSLI